MAAGIRARTPKTPRETHAKDAPHTPKTTHAKYTAHAPKFSGSMSAMSNMSGMFRMHTMADMSGYFMNVKNVRNVQYVACPRSHVGGYTVSETSIMSRMYSMHDVCFHAQCLHPGDVQHVQYVQHVRNVQNIYRVPKMPGMCIMSGMYRVRDVCVRPSYIQFTGTVQDVGNVL